MLRRQVTQQAPLVLALLLARACCHGASAAPAPWPPVPAAMARDPEYLFDMARPNMVSRIATPSAPFSAREVSALLDDDSTTYKQLALPSAGEGQQIMQVVLKEPRPIIEASLNVNQTASVGNFLPCLSTAVWVRTSSSSAADVRTALASNAAAGSVLRTMPNRAADKEYKPTSARVMWLLPAGAAPAPGTVWTLVLPKACKTPGLSAALTELHLYVPVNLKAPFNSSAKILDDHFHPCSFSNQCTDVKTIVAEQKRQGVFASFLFGLQHNMLKGAAPWITAVFGKDKQDDKYGLLDETPYHYADLAAQPSSMPTAKPGIDQVNLRRTSFGLANISGYEGFREDNALTIVPRPGFSPHSYWYWYWNTISQYHDLTKDAASGAKGHAYPFLSSMRIDNPPGYTRYTVCTQSNVSDMTVNEMLFRAMDTIFPGSVFGGQEYNLNKTVVAMNNVNAPVLDATWKGCMSGVFKYMAETRRPFGIHYDIQPWQPSELPMITLAREFKDTIMVWDHGGSAPEVDKRLSAADHIRLMQAFLDTSPGRRYVDFSWNTGFWLRLLPKALGSVEMNGATMQEQPRNWAEDCKAYMGFMKKNSDAIMFGSDQVSLNYPDSLSRDLNGGVIFNRPGYFQAAAAYGASLRQEVGLLYNCMSAAVQAGGEQYRLPPSVIDKIFWANGDKIMRGVVMPSPGAGACKADSKSRKEGPGSKAAARSCVSTGVERNQALKFVRSLFELQWRELREGAGADAPTLDQFLPATLKQATGSGRRLL